MKASLITQDHQFDQPDMKQKGSKKMSDAQIARKSDLDCTRDTTLRSSSGCGDQSELNLKVDSSSSSALFNDSAIESMDEAQRQIKLQANYIMILKKALKEVLDQNDTLTDRVRELEQIVIVKEQESAQKDKAIVELAQLCDLHMGGELHNAIQTLDQTHTHNDQYDAQSQFEDGGSFQNEQFEAQSQKSQ
ncbi:UNKNOWN [Stylonychia lemnae]|uniref:Uncharacterized protein n=1 Tax=Stylonychia lemnae TaxID=5949 RepID=A0A078B8F8_STYLE|nr:UNKNOWN [Stylonychia lemnae]|eukprot:CDW89577.1 UNKNOWN [Stylonychia lemnae]